MKVTQKLGSLSICFNNLTVILFAQMSKFFEIKLMYFVIKTSQNN